jgi:hypothetical protein
MLSDSTHSDAMNRMRGEELGRPHRSLNEDLEFILAASSNNHIVDLNSHISTPSHFDNSTANANRSSKSLRKTQSNPQDSL